MFKKMWKELLKFMAWWAGLFCATGTGTCPCCGQASCPGGAITSGLIAALIVAICFFPRLIVKNLRKLKAK